MNTSDDYLNAYSRIAHDSKFEFTFSIKHTSLSGELWAKTVASAMQLVKLRWAKSVYDNLSYSVLMARANAQFNNAKPSDFSLDSEHARNVAQGFAATQELRKRAQKIVICLDRDSSI